MRASLEALTAPSSQPRNDWLQIGTRPRDRLRMCGDLCQHISSFARRVLNDSLAGQCFFMNKPPGMRLRFRAAATTSSADLANVVERRGRCRWQAAGLIDHIEHGVYEPETRLVGGPRSMRFRPRTLHRRLAHLAWTHHACRAVEGSDQPRLAGVSGSAANDIRRSPDRRMGKTSASGTVFGTWPEEQLGQDKASLLCMALVLDELRNAWSRRDRILEDLHPAVQGNRRSS